MFFEGEDLKVMNSYILLYIKTNLKVKFIINKTTSLILVILHYKDFPHQSMSKFREM